MSAKPFIIEKTFNAQISKVWKALTDKDEMKKWYFDLEQFRPEEGFEFRFEGGADDRKYIHICRITEVIPNKKLSYSWKYDGYAGDSLVTFELFPEGNKTRIRLTHDGLETFPSDNTDFAKKNFETGWTEIINTSLKEYLEKTKN
jgi:uncharacterized protein YndB with AHSA1/START domain